MRYIKLIGLLLAGLSLMQGLAHADPIWKRAAMLKGDLARALSLPQDQLCLELGQYSCLDNVHNFALGGRDPFARAQYQSMEKPSQLTVAAFDRSILQACIERVKRDGVAAGAVVFKYYSLTDTLQSLSDESIRQQIRELYRRFYLRDATLAEEETALQLADRQRFAQVSGAFFSQALCLAVGSQWAYLFF